MKRVKQPLIEKIKRKPGWQHCIKMNKLSIIFQSEKGSASETDACKSHQSSTVLKFPSLGKWYEAQEDGALEASVSGSQELELAMCIPLKVAWADPFCEYRYVSFKILVGWGLTRSYLLWILLI